jgi:hydroxymethylglutaryl-CoA reductase (NADPH)
VASPTRIPRDGADDYAPEIITSRQDYVERCSGARLHHVRRFSFDPHAARGNCEQLTGVAQVPLGFAGPLRVEGEHARGEFLIPLATSEGTLVASYNRGMGVLTRCGGVRATVVDDAMQRAPVFLFADAVRGREFARWVVENQPRIREVAESTSRVVRLLYIDPCLSNRFVFLRFNFQTGDAAGQNMVTRATAEACAWIVREYPGVERFFLESNFATDKKHSHVNTLRTRGKRVTAEAVVDRNVLFQHMRARPESLVAHYHTANIGAFLAGTNNNGVHAANAIAALFIATGQDVANVAESSAGIVFTEITPTDDLYLSITLPSLIVATYGGGTALPTQRECLEALGCFGPGRVRKLAEIVAAVVLAGELSLAAAIAANEWVASHERLGRNR